MDDEVFLPESPGKSETIEEKTQQFKFDIEKYKKFKIQLFSLFIIFYFPSNLLFLYYIIQMD
jgi:hypothetical protein